MLHNEADLGKILPGSSAPRALWLSGEEGCLLRSTYYPFPIQLRVWGWSHSPLRPASLTGLPFKVSEEPAGYLRRGHLRMVLKAVSGCCSAAVPWHAVAKDAVGGLFLSPSSLMTLSFLCACSAHCLIIPMAGPKSHLLTVYKR